MKENLTAIVSILDASGSMAGIVHDTIQGFNSFVAEQKALPGEAVLTLAIFSSGKGNYKLVHNAAPLQSVEPLTTREYRPGGGTALYDAIVKTVDEVGVSLAAMPEDQRPSKVLVLITTDGFENESTHTSQDVHNRITHQTEKYSWNFIYIGANQDAITAGQAIGVVATNSYNYVADSVGTRSLFRSVSYGTSAYRSANLDAEFSMPDLISKLDSQLKDSDNTFVIDGDLFPTKK